METFTDPIAVAIKVALGSGLALLACRFLGVDDGVSAAFVAVLCTTPTVLSGLQRAATQFLGSLIGGVVAATLGTLGLPVELTLPASVGIAVGAIFPLGQGHAYAVAAFTAIYMNLLPHGGVGQTLALRIAAVAVGGAAAAVVNVAISAAFYERIFSRRVRLGTATLAEALQRFSAGDTDSDVLLPVFPILNEVAAEIEHAEHELRWRRSAQLDRIACAEQQLRALTRVAHFARDLGLSVEAAGGRLSEADVAVLTYAAARLRRLSAPRPTPGGEIGQRLLATIDRWEALCSVGVVR